MNTRTAEKLYSTELLALATELAAVPLTEDFPLIAEARSRTCGSSLKIGVEQAADGTIKRIGLAVSACAVGQAAAAIFARSCVGADQKAIRESFAELENWLADPHPPLPSWPGLASLEPARVHKGRHGAIMLPWRGAIAALSNEGSRS